MLVVKNLVKSFPHSFEPVLKNINLEIARGDFCTMIGSNGSGKSTLFKTITGEHTTTSGHIYLDDVEVYAQSLHQRSQYISSVTQDISAGIIDDMTLLENITLSFLRGKTAKLRPYNDAYEKSVKRALKKVNMGLEKHLNTPIANLSGGQKQVVATIMAIESSPKLLLLDEHTSALDPKISKKLMEYTAESVYNAKTTCIMITHNLEDALRYGNKLIMMHRGKIVFMVEGQDKDSLKVADLLDMFHQYEDKILVHQDA